MEETPDSGGRHTDRELILHCTTENGYECFNYRIINDFEKKGNHIYLKFQGIARPDICLTSPGPAKASINLGKLEDRVYTITVSNGGSSEDIKLTVSSGTYLVSPAGTKNVRFTNNPLHRLPANTIWGIVGYVNVSQNQMINSFSDSLEYYGAKPYTGDTGDYYYFYLNKDRAIVDSGNGYWESRKFIYNYTGNYANLKALVSRYKQREDSLSIYVHSYKGELFR